MGITKNEKKSTETHSADRRKFLKATTLAGAGMVALSAGVGQKRIAYAAKVVKGPRYAMLIDLKRCIGCHTCTVACKAENEVPLGVFRTYVHYLEKGKYPKTRRYFASTLCNHCSKPPCVEVCPVDLKEATFKRPDGVEVKYDCKATYQRPDGVVLVDNDRCIGCHACVEACPYKARFVDPSRKAGANPDSNCVGKCTYCVHRIDEDVVPSCVQTCVGGALTFGDINDPASEITKSMKKKKTQVWHPKHGTKPNTYYIDLIDSAVLGKEVKAL